MAGGYLGFDSWLKAYHVAFAIAGDVKKQFDSVAKILRSQQDLHIETQISGRRVERRVLLRQVNDVRFKAKKVSKSDREVLEHIIHDLQQQISDLDGEIWGLEEKLKK